jgi:hypothetical protein
VRPVAEFAAFTGHAMDAPPASLTVEDPGDELILEGMLRPERLVVHAPGHLEHGLTSALTCLRHHRHALLTELREVAGRAQEDLEVAARHGRSVASTAHGPPLTLVDAANEAEDAFTMRGPLQRALGWGLVVKSAVGAGAVLLTFPSQGVIGGSSGPDSADVGLRFWGSAFLCTSFLGLLLGAWVIRRGRNQ